MEQSWTTADVGEHERFAYWREIVCRAFVELAPERRGGSQFAGAIRTASLAEIAVSRIASRAQLVRRTEPAIDRTPEPLAYVNVQIRGTSMARQDGRTAYLDPGDAVVVDALRPFELEVDADFEQLSLHMSRDALFDRLATPSAATAVTIRGSTPHGRMAFATLYAAADCAGDADAAEAAALAEHATSAVALALRATGPQAPARSRRRAEHLQAILDDVARNLGDPDLRPASTAARVGLSSRYVHDLLAEHGTTFGRLVRHRRLDGCRRELRDPSFDHWTVAEIAMRWGFANPSHFARSYRAAHGVAPQQERARRFDACLSSGVRPKPR